MRSEPGKPQTYEDGFGSAEFYEQFLDYRYEHPGDDLITRLISTEFEDVDGTVRTLTRDEALMYLNVIAGAGNHTTNRLIGWTAKVLAEHPDARREVVQDRSLVPNTIEETLRYEPSSTQIARYVDRDVELYGQTVPEGSAMLCLVGSANRDERMFPDGDRFDIHRKIGHHLTFGYGAPLLPGCGVGAARRSRGARGDAEPLHRLGSRLRRVPARDVSRSPRVRSAPHRHHVTKSPAKEAEVGDGFDVPTLAGGDRRHRVHRVLEGLGDEHLRLGGPGGEGRGRRCRPRAERHRRARDVRPRRFRVPRTCSRRVSASQSMSYFVDQYLGGSVSLSIIGSAALAVSAGVADCVVCYRALNGRSEQRMNASGAGGEAARGTSSTRCRPATSCRPRRWAWPRVRTWSGTARRRRTSAAWRSSAARTRSTTSGR